MESIAIGGKREGSLRSLRLALQSASNKADQKGPVEGDVG